MQESPEGIFAIPDADALQADTVAPVEPEASSGAPSKVGAALERQRDTLMTIEGVVMVGEGQDEIGRDAIVIGVKQHHQLKTLPQSVEGIRVVGIVIGEVDALGSPGVPR